MGYYSFPSLSSLQLQHYCHCLFVNPISLHILLAGVQTLLNLLHSLSIITVLANVLSAVFLTHIAQAEIYINARN